MAAAQCRFSRFVGRGEAMGQCNFCSLREIKKRARKEKQRVTTFPWKGGIECYVHPWEVEPVKEDESPYFTAWFMRLPDHCVCHED